MSQRLIVLLIEARHVLGGMSQGDFGELLGMSRRTGQRWEGGHATPSPTQLHELARLVHPHDPALAASVAAEAGTTLEELGIAQHPAALAEPPPSAPATPPLSEVIDALVCVAAEAIDVTPRTIRPALLAAFARARRLGLRIEDVEKALFEKGIVPETAAGTETTDEEDA